MWLHKYEPKTLDDFVSNRNSIYKLKQLYSKDHNNLFIITGNTGIGKTILSKLFLKHYNYKINYLSCYEEHTNSNIKIKLNKMLNFKNILEIMTNNIYAIILKDVDNYINDILKIIKEGTIKRTIIIILNNYKNLKKLKKYNIIQLDKPKYIDIEKFILDISLENKFYISEDGIKIIYEHSNGDIRFTILFLEELNFYVIKKKATSNINKDKLICISKDEISMLIDIKKKDISYDIYSSIKEILYKKNSIDRNLYLSKIDSYFIPTIIYDNLQALILKNNIDLNYYLKCLENISLSEYLNIKNFENQTSVSTDISLILNTCYSNFVLNKNKIQTIPIQYSVLMNKILKINNSQKIYNTISRNKNLNSNHILLLLKYAIYYDKKKDGNMLDYYFNYFNIESKTQKFIRKLLIT